MGDIPHPPCQIHARGKSLHCMKPRLGSESLKWFWWTETYLDHTSVSEHSLPDTRYLLVESSHTFVFASENYPCMVTMLSTPANHSSLSHIARVNTPPVGCHFPYMVARMSAVFQMTVPYGDTGVSGNGCQCHSLRNKHSIRSNTTRNLEQI
jgi:hypothetical protein